MANQWTPAQLQAMQLHGTDILVSAAAGSGKTATLTERIIRDLKGENGLPPADISRMLIVTFTRAAARELRSRISQALSDAIAQDPENRHLYRQLLALGSARICTIDAFYQQPVRANFERLGLPPSFRLADENELAPLKKEIMSRLLDEFYTANVPADASEEQPLSVLHGNAFVTAMDDLMPNRDRGKTIDVLLKLHHQLLNFPEGLQCLARHADRLEAQAALPLHQSAEGQVLISAAVEILTSVYDRACAALAVFAEDADAMLLYAEQTTYDAETVQAALRDFAANDPEHAIAVLRAYAPKDYGRRTKKIQPNERSLAAKEMRKLWRADIANATALFVESPEERQAQMLRTARTERMLHALLCAYDESLRERKRSRDVLEFSDVRRALLTLLLDESGQPTDVARDLCDSFDAVYIDEYQDVDTVQDTIFATVGAGGKRFMVGDIKQSIYGFRGAEPSIFADYRRSFGTADDGDGRGVCLFMSENFRCDSPVIEFTNAVCGYIFGVCEKTLGYRPDDDLVRRKRIPEGYTPTPVQLVLLEPAVRDGEDIGEGDGGEAIHPEAAYIAAEIDRLCREEVRADGQPIRPRDIAVLLRKTTLAGEITRALNAYGIETTYASHASLATHPDMITLVNVLSVIDNPRDDTPLMGLLSTEKSPFALQELLAIRHGYSPDIPLYDAICLAAQSAPTDAEDDTCPPLPLTPEITEKCRKLVDFITRWQNVARALPIDRLLRKLYSEPSFAPKATTPVYLSLYESARTYQNNAFCGLYQFLRHFRKLLEGKGNLNAGGMEGSDDAVSILTIHKSKGLEFPVVFVGHCAAAFSDDDLTAPIVFDHDLGMATHLFCEQDASMRDHIVRRAITTKLREKLVEEEMRLLYVAMTRARERLYLTAKLRGRASTPIAAANVPMRGDRTAITSASSYVPWLLGAMSPANRQKEQADPNAPDAFWRLHVVNSADYATLPALATSPRPPAPVTESEDDPIAASAAPFGSAAFYRAVVREHESYTDPRALLRTLPTKAAASKLHYDLLDRGFLPEALDDGEQSPTPVQPPEQHASESERIKSRIALLQSTRRSFPELLQQRQLADAAERGTATHLFLQYCSYEHLHELRTTHSATQAVEQEISRLVTEGFLSRRTADILNRRHLAAFVGSDLFSMVLHAKQSWRELHFNRFLPYAALTQREEFAAQLQGASLYVQGSLDLLLQDEDGELTLCDYKTDRLRIAEPVGECAEPDRKQAIRRQLAADHADQLRIYADAVASLFGKAPKRVLIYSLPLGCTVDLSDEVLSSQ